MDINYDSFFDELAKMASDKEAGFVSGVGGALANAANVGKLHAGKFFSGQGTLGGALKGTMNAAGHGFNRGKDLMRGAVGPMTPAMAMKHTANTRIGTTALGAAGLGAGALGMKAMSGGNQ